MASIRLIGINVIQVRENDAGRTCFRKVTDVQKREIKAEGYDLFPMYFLDDDYVRGLRNVASRKNS